MAVARGQSEGGDEQAAHTFKSEKKKPIVDAVMSGYTSKPIGCPLPTGALM